MFQRLPVQVLHGNEGSPRRLADVVDGANVAMVKRAGGTSLTLEPGDRSWVCIERLGQELQRYQALQPGIASLIDDPHPPPPHFLVMRWWGMVWPRTRAL